MVVAIQKSIQERHQSEEAKRGVSFPIYPPPQERGEIEGKEQSKNIGGSVTAYRKKGGRKMNLKKIKGSKRNQYINNKIKKGVLIPTGASLEIKANVEQK